MGNGMNKILPGVYVGSIRDAKNEKELADNGITHILSIHDNAQKVFEDKEYLCINASDTATQELTQYFSKCNDFIHSARLKGGNVLIHCLAGVSRSVTVTAAYIMTVTKLGWRDAINAVRGARNRANPNFGFQRQLQKFEMERVKTERKRLKEKFPQDVVFNDEEECRKLLHSYQRFVLHGDSRGGDDLYPLPHNAYKDREQPASGGKETENADR